MQILYCTMYCLSNFAVSRQVHTIKLIKRFYLVILTAHGTIDSLVLIFPPQFILQLVEAHDTCCVLVYRSSLTVLNACLSNHLTIHMTFLQCAHT